MANRPQKSARRNEVHQARGELVAPRAREQIGAALTNLAALLSGAANAVRHHDKARVLSTRIEPRSAGRELTIS